MGLIALLDQSESNILSSVHYKHVNNLVHVYSKQLQYYCYFLQSKWYSGKRGGLLVSALDSRPSGPGLSTGQGHYVVFLGKTLYSHSDSLHPGV